MAELFGSDDKAKRLTVAGRGYFKWEDPVRQRLGSSACANHCVNSVIASRTFQASIEPAALKAGPATSSASPQRSGANRRAGRMNSIP
jgi:hypothetical protein